MFSGNRKQGNTLERQMKLTLLLIAVAALGTGCANTMPIEPEMLDISYDKPGELRSLQFETFAPGSPLAGENYIQYYLGQTYVKVDNFTLSKDGNSATAVASVLGAVECILDIQKSTMTASKDFQWVIRTIKCSE